MSNLTQENPDRGRAKWFTALINKFKSLKKPIEYFLPGQMAFLVDGALDVNTEGDLNVINGILAWANQAAIAWSEEHDYEQPVEFTLRSASPFPLEQNGFTLIFTNVVGINSSKDLVNLILYLEKRRAEASAPGILRGLSLNWFVNGSSQPGGTGGPGSWPIEAQPPQGDSWQFWISDEDYKMTSLPTGNEKEDGKEVHIAILDTMPSELAIEKAYQEWRWHHPLLNDINNTLSAGSMTVHRANFTDLSMTVDYNISGHNYLMRDHGLFVAGLIHTIAPNATLHLYEVLNPYGIGSFESITNGLSKILADKKNRPLIINCSFMLDIPVTGTEDPDFPVELRSSINSFVTTYKTSFEKLTKDGEVIIVAAAGNDAKYNNADPGTRPHTRYPAAFENVLGVGALPRGFPTASDKPASYSNLAEEPPKNGYLTLGGEAGPERGVLGVYIGDFPQPAGCLWGLWRVLTLGMARFGRYFLPRIFWDFIRVRYKRNLTGWAWWAGTSFATAIFSGTLANLFSQKGIRRTEPFDINSVPTILSKYTQHQKTAEEENLVLIEQR